MKQAGRQQIIGKCRVFSSESGMVLFNLFNEWQKKKHIHSYTYDYMIIFY